MPILSIIVPVYNVEKYLDRCVESILAQTFTDFELILVDDGSPDNCGKMCDEYAKKDQRITVIHKRNGGLSDARNAGLDIAKGEFVGFVDSDDWIHPQMYELLYKAIISDEFDFAQCVAIQPNLKEKDKGICYSDIDYKHYEEPIVDARSVDEILEVYDKYVVSGCSQAIKLYKTSVFDSLRFPVGLFYEDSYIIVDILDKCQNVALVPMGLYYYYSRSDSIMNSGITSKSFNRLDVIEHNIDFFERRGENNRIEKFTIEYLFAFMRLYFKSFGTKGLKDVRKDYYKNFKRILNEYGNRFNLCRLYKTIIVISKIHPILAYPFYKFAIR